MKKSITFFYFLFFSFLHFIQSQQKAFFDFKEGKAIGSNHLPTVVVAEGSSDQRLYQKREDDFMGDSIYEQECLLTPPTQAVSILLLPQKKVTSKTFMPIKESFQCPGCDKKFKTPFYLRCHKEKKCFPSKREPRFNCCFCLKPVCVGALSQHLNLEHFNAKVPVGGFPEVAMERCIVEGCCRVFFGNKKTRLRDHLRGDHNMYKNPPSRRYSV